MRKRNGVPSGELSDTRRLGSADARWYTSQGEKAVFRRRSIAARNAVKTPGETARGAGARPRCDATRRTRPEVPSAVTVGAAAGRTEAGGGELCRTRPRQRICIRRVGRRTHKSPALHREHCCPDRDRTLEGKPARISTEKPPETTTIITQKNSQERRLKICENRRIFSHRRGRKNGIIYASKKDAKNG